MDACECCGNEQSDYACCGCDKRICGMCESGYYSDEILCMACRHDITPEEEAQGRQYTANEMANQCTCPKTAWTGSEPNDSTCELDESEHEFIRKYASTRQA
jgi:hypothetical protein